MRIDPPFVPDIDLIDCYLAGELSSTDAERVHQWTTSRADRDALVEVLCTHARGVAPERVIDVERGVQLLWGLSVSAEQPSGPRPSSRGRVLTRGNAAPYTFKGLQILGAHTPQRRIWSTAAVLVLGVAVLVVGWTAGIRHDRQHATEASLAYATGSGERATITLPDGGTVALNVASRLEVPVDYVAGHHTVRLVGEGLFTVPHQDGAPFTVLAGGTAARVLGTSFVVRRYATDTTTLVVVRDGKVAVGNAVVTAAHLVEVGRTGVARVRPSDGAPFTFATGVLTLSGVPLSAAIAELDRWYDADIRLGEPSLADRGIKGEVSAGSLADLAGFLEFTLGVRVVRNGRVLTLFPKE